jgi:hypothetical protein
MVFWIGEDLTPWMADAVETLAGDASVTALLEAEGTILLDFREGALFEAHGHDHDGHDDDDHDHDHDDDHDDHGHDDHAQDDHGHDDLGHAHGDHDPHAWLSPENARTWLNIIAAELSAADPDNAGAYFANAAAARDEIEALQAEVETTLSPVRGGRFIVFHDAYQYFESAFRLPRIWRDFHQRCVRPEPRADRGDPGPGSHGGRGLRSRRAAIQSGPRHRGSRRDRGAHRRDRPAGGRSHPRARPLRAGDPQHGRDPGRVPLTVVTGHDPDAPGPPRSGCSLFASFLSS